MKYLKIEKAFIDCKLIENPDQLIDLFKANDLITLSWGAHFYKNLDCKALRFSVEARRHKGHIYILLNVNDTFNVYFTDIKAKINDQAKDIKKENLIDFIDKKIQWIESYIK
jgi:hypothetical protein